MTQSAATAPPGSRERAEALAEKICPCETCFGNGEVYRSRLGNTQCVACGGRGFTEEAVQAIESAIGDVEEARQSALMFAADWCQGAAEMCEDRLRRAVRLDEIFSLRAKADVCSKLASRMREEARRT